MAAEPQTGQLTIDQLAEEVGMTVRNVRAHQSRGLLPPPTLRGRTGFYAHEHVVRLELIKELQADGLNLEAIRQILETTPGSSVAEVLGFTRAVVEPFSDEQPEIFDLDDIGARWGDRLTPELLDKVLKMGFARMVGERQVEVLSPRLERAAGELADMGIPPESAITILESLRKHSESVAKAYVRLFVENVLRPMQADGLGPDGWNEVSDRMAQLRPLASEALLAVFQIVMTEQVERQLERELQRMGSHGRKRR